MAELTCFTLNVNGLKSKDRQLYLKDFIAKNNIDILCLQETHIDNYFISKNIEHLLGLENRILWSFGQGRCNGVAILFINQNIRYSNFYCGFDGRLIVSDFALHENKFRLINLYAPNNESDRNIFFDDLVPRLVTSKHLIITGDYNFVFNTELDKIGGNSERGTVGSKTFSNILKNFVLTDAFRYLFPKRKLVTWYRHFEHESIGCRLDRFYISSFLKENIVKCDILPCSISDHDFVYIKLNLNNALTFGESYWKLNNNILDDDNFISNFEYFWQIVSRTNDITLEWWDEMKILIKDFCIDFSKRKHQGDFFEIKKLSYSYQKCTNLEEKIDIKSKIKKIETDLHKGSSIRSKVNLIDSNENPSKNFCMFEQKKGKDKTIFCINDNNVIHKDSKHILKSFSKFYENLYTDEPVDSSLNDIFLNNLPQVSKNDNLILGSPISKDEIFTVLKDMDPNKSPGCDGLSCLFYLRFFHLFGSVLETLFNICYTKGEMSESQKLSYITLICKDRNNSSLMKNYRPISLLNIDRKIVAKVVSNRLSKF